MGAIGRQPGRAVAVNYLTTPRDISLSGDANGNVSFDGSANVTIDVVVADDSHNHVISNVDGLQTALDEKQDTLVSGTNIKTVGGTSLLGSGDVALASSAVDVTYDNSTSSLDATNVQDAIDEVAVSSFPAGTTMLFQQTTAPTGWTKQTSHDNKALRVVSGTAGSGGSVDFTTAFASYTPAGSVSITGGGVSASSLTVAQLASHNHIVGGFANASGGGGSAAYATLADYSSNNNKSASYTGSNSSHTHGFTTPSGSFTGTAQNFEVQYVDIIIASKD